VCLFILGCEDNDSEILVQEADSVLQQSNKHIYEYNEVIKQVDSQVAEKVKVVVFQMKTLEAENKQLKTDFLKIKKVSRVVRDTIYITEKKNFWGKTKKTIDSTQSIIEDSLQTQNN
jgi:hypothetical protein